MKKTVIIALAVLFFSGCSKELPFGPRILSYDGNKVSETFATGKGGTITTSDGAVWSVATKSARVKGDASATDYEVTFTLKEGSMPSGGAAVEFVFDGWTTDNYVFAPCHLYNGNRFRILPIGYPPLIYDPADRPLDMPVTTVNVPHLNADGSDSSVGFKTNSCATPLAGFYDKAAKRGFFVLTEQDTVLGDRAFKFTESVSQNKMFLTLSAPGVREYRYTMCNANHPSDDEGIPCNPGQTIDLSFRVYDFDCEDLMAYFDRFFTIRKALSGQNDYPTIEPFSSVLSTIFKHEFEHKWYEDENFGYYCNKPDMDIYFGHLQLGWNGVPVYTHANLLQKSDPQYEENVRRAARTFDSINYMQGASGLFNGIMMRGEILGDNFRDCRTERDVAMIRRTALTVYFSLQCFDLMKAEGRGDFVKPEWEEMCRKAADGLVDLWNRYGEFGQLVKAESGEIHTPNSTQGALCMGALAYASKYFNEAKYLETAEAAGRYYYDRDLSKGYVGGGPGEILQAPDSESSAELAESFVALYELTGDVRWLENARSAAAYFSSWVVSYNYRFPEESGMYKCGIKPAGSVWASVQNEHSAPGIYVLSGDFLLKLYRATGDTRYIELLKDIVHNVVQYVNLESHRTQAHGGFGYCTERCNIGDWEGTAGIGGVADCDSNSAWENVTICSIQQNPGIYITPDNGFMMVIDHVEARLVSSDDSTVTVEISNSTSNDADVSVLAETTSHARKTPLGWNASSTWPRVHVPAGETVTVSLPVL